MITTMLKFSLGLLMLTTAFDVSETYIEATLAVLLGVGLILMALWDMKEDMDGWDAPDDLG
jgi:hypothetical protein